MYFQWSPASSNLGRVHISKLWKSLKRKEIKGYLVVMSELEKALTEKFSQDSQYFEVSSCERRFLHQSNAIEYYSQPSAARASWSSSG